MDDNITKTLAGVTFDDLRKRVAGRVILPDDPDYEEARSVWNGMIDRKPAAVVRAANVRDIAPTLRFARKHGLPIAIRGGGHSVAGNGTVDGGLVLDLGALRDVRVDAESRLVLVEPGATLADVDRATEPFGLVVPLGVISGTGVAGLTVGGGIGWLTRAHGLTIDSLESAEVVTAAGRNLRASATENPELFWGIRGGGGNFGVVSGFTFRAHPLPAEVYSGNLVYGPDRWPDALRTYAAWSRWLPDTLTSIVSFFVPPPHWELGVDPVMVLGFTWAAPNSEEGERIVDQLRRAAPPDVESIEPVRWVDWQSASDDLFPKGVRAYWKNTSFDHLDADVIELLLRRAGEQTWRGTGFDIHHMGGAYGRVAEYDTAFPNRSARYWLNVYGFWARPDDDAAMIDFVRGVVADMEPYSSGGQYVNFNGWESGADPHAQALAVYGEEKLERLIALKREFDPGNLFRQGHTIPPEQPPDQPPARGRYS